MNEHILLVEDDSALQTLALKILRHAGYEVSLAETGTAAVATALGPDPPALVLMDLALPEMDGWQATREIKAVRRDLTVVAVSANAMTTDRAESVAAGCNDFLSKPYSREDLLAMVAQYVGDAGVMRGG